MKTHARFYHAGCPVCVAAQQQVAEAEGVQSVPALVIGGQLFHINFSAAIADLK